MAFDYEAAKAEFGVARAREMEKESRGAVSAQTDAPQATSQPQAGGGEKKAGVGGGGWNEDFDEAWGRRVLENPKLKEQFGLSGYESLRDEETRRQINRWLRNNQGGEQGGGGGGAAAAGTAQPAAATSTTGAAKKAEAGVVQPPGTTGKTSLPGGVKPPPSGPPLSSTSILAPGRLPSSPLWRNTIVPASGGEIPQMNGPWWPSYPAGNAPPASRPATASLQAAALMEQE